jgi:hypothetical protein
MDLNTNQKNQIWEKGKVIDDVNPNIKRRINLVRRLLHQDSMES